MDESPLERAFDTQFIRLGQDLPMPEKQYEAIPDRRFRFDRAWPCYKLLVELEGGTMGKRVVCQSCGTIVRALKADGSLGAEIRQGGFHQTKRFAMDVEKYNLAALYGYTLLRFTREDVYGDPFSMVKMIRQAIEMAGTPTDVIEELTEKELDVLVLVAAGLVTNEIADRLEVSKNTVRSHSQNICEKLITRNRSAAVARAIAWGLLDPNCIPFPQDFDEILDDY